MPQRALGALWLSVAAPATAGHDFNTTEYSTMEQNKRSRGGSGAWPPSPRKLIAALAIAGTAMVPGVTLGDSIACGGAYTIAYVTPPTPPDPRFVDDVLTYQVTLTNQDPASTWTISSIQRKLDCQAGSDFSTCSDPGGAIQFVSMGSSTCKDATSTAVTITPDNSVSNLTTFGLSAPIVLPPNTAAPNNVCTIQFTAKIAGLSQDASANTIASRDKVNGTCDPSGESDGSATGSITTSVNTCGITLKKQVFNGTTWLDADNAVDGDGEDVLKVVFKDADPIAATDTGNVLYRLLVKNTSTVDMSSVTVSDSALGIDPAVEVGPIAAGIEKTVTSGTAGMAKLNALGRCTASGDLENTSNATGICRAAAPVVDEDASNNAWVRCVGVPHIKLLKEVSLTGNDGDWHDANAHGDADVPQGAFGADAYYRITVTNDGTVDLKDVVVNDSTLSISNYVIGDLAIGASKVLTQADISKLFFADRCDTRGYKDNTAHVDGHSVDDDSLVQSEDPAVINCVGTTDIKIVKEISVDGKPFADANAIGDSDVPTVEAPHDALYRLTVTNIGTVPLVDPHVVDGILGIDVTLTGVTLMPGVPYVITSGSTDFGKLDAKNRCEGPGDFVNTASVTADPIDGVGPPVSDTDPAALVCTGNDLCLTHTPGFWGTHPEITDDFLPITVCGKTIDSTALNNHSSTEAMCVSAVDAKNAKPTASNMNYLQLVRQLTAAKLNVAASATNEGTCNVVGGVNIDDLIASCEAAALCGDSGAKGGSKITASGCIDKLDAFNNSDDTLAPFGPFVTPGPANSTTCQTANGDGIIVR